MRPLVVTAFLLCWVLGASAALGARPEGRAVPAAPQQTQIFDLDRRIDANLIDMWVTNFGSHAFDISTGNSGLIYPKGTQNTALFASGLWLGCKVGGQVRTVVAEYSFEYGPGPMIGGTFDDPNRPEHRVYKVVRWTGDPADSSHVTRVAPADSVAHHSWSEYLEGAAPYGAPTRMYRLPVTVTPDPNDSVDVLGPDVTGDQMLWCVYNDADPSLHTSGPGGSSPLGVEIQQTMFGFSRTSALGFTVFIEYRIINKGMDLLDSMYVSLWSDPDLGGFTDDLVGCDTTLSLGYCYNANNNDNVYDSRPPAVGYDLLRGPVNAAGDTLGMSSFIKYIGGTDPGSASDTYTYMQGLLPYYLGPLVDPTTGDTTRYFNPGDPVTGTGWLDNNPADRRMMLSSGPFSMAPGDTQVVVAALIIGQGTSRLQSITALRSNALAARAFYEQSFSGPLPPPLPLGVDNCPRTPDYWYEQCIIQDQFTAAMLGQVAAHADSGSTLFDWAPGSDLSEFRSVVAPSVTGDVRVEATREYAALLANQYAGSLFPDPSHFPSSADVIFVNSVTPIGCQGLPQTSIGELLKPAGLTPMFQGAEYVNNNQVHRRALTGVNWGARGFFGGADTGWYFWGGTLDSDAMPDSFTTVEIRFDSTNPSMAYRYLRLEQSNGSVPTGGREYRYAGFVPINLQAWDVVNNQQLEVMFVERCVAAADGTIQPPAAQPATFDSTWAPDESEFGSREYLFILKTPYSATPRPEYEVDDAMDTALDMPGGTAIGAPILYAMWVRLRSASDVIDDGDAFRFDWGPGGGVDLSLIQLAGQPLSDPAVQHGYQDIIDCLGPINRGIGIGTVCGTETAQVVFLGADADPSRARLTWSMSGTPGLTATIERRDGGSIWTSIGTASASPGGLLEYADSTVAAGTRYGYRLALRGGQGDRHYGEGWIEVPGTLSVGLQGLRPNPADRELVVSFSLLSGERATLELIDIAGRRVWSREVGSLGPGSHVLNFGSAVHIKPGIYMLRLRQGGREVSRKAAFVH